MTDDATESWLTPGRRRFLSGVGAAAGATLAGCLGDEPSEGTDSPSDDGPTRLSLGISRGGWDLIPARDTDFDSNKVYTLIYDNVVNLSPDGEIVPDLASDWSRESDTQYVFELEEGVTFHNGEEFTAEDVAYTYDWIQTEENPRRNYLAAVEDVVAEDDHTVRFDLSEPFAPFLYKVHAVMWPLSRAAYEEHGEEYNANPVGTGPYELTEWESGNRALLETFDDYWRDDQPHIDEIEFRILPDDSSKVAQLESGSIHAVDRMPPQHTDRVESTDGVEVVTTGGVSSGRVDFNTDVEPLDDRRVRRALTWAIDKERIVETVLQGYGTPATAILPDSFPQYNDDVSDFAHPNGDPDRARELLADAGQEGLSLEIKTSTSSRHERTATLVQSMWDEVDVEASVRTIEGGAFWTQEQEGDYEVAVSNWEWFGDPDTLLYLYHSEGLNVWNIDDQELDDLLDEQRRLVDPDARREVIDEIQRIVYEEAYSVNTYYPQRIQGIATAVDGFEQYANGSFRSLGGATFE